MGEPLEEDARQLILLQPAKMSINRATVVCGEQFGNASVRERQRCRTALIRRELGHIRPHVYANARAARWFATAKPVLPRAQRRSIPRTAEPALISKQ